MGRRVGGFRVATSSNSPASIVRRLLWPSLTAAVMLALTLGLGFWQVERLAWKTALLANIDRAEAEPPIPLPDRPDAFQRVVAEGSFLPIVGLYGAEVRAGVEGPVMGARLLGALQRSGAPPVIVDRGWAPIDFNPAPPSGPQRIEGYVRPAERTSWLGASDDPVHRRFFALNPAAIGAAFGLNEVTPYTLVAMGHSAGFPQAAIALPRPPNDHLAYAITWFSLSAALAVVFSLFVRQTLSRESAP